MDTYFSTHFFVMFHYFYNTASANDILLLFVWVFSSIRQHRGYFSSFPVHLPKRTLVTRNQLTAVISLTDYTLTSVFAYYTTRYGTGFQLSRKHPKWQYVDIPLLVATRSLREDTLSHVCMLPWRQTVRPEKSRQICCWVFNIHIMYKRFTYPSMIMITLCDTFFFFN